MNLILSINIAETFNPKTIAIVDTTVYGGTVVVNPSVEITAPGFEKKSLVFTPGAINTYNANNLVISNVSSFNDLPPLPDGIYGIKYSVFPNSTKFTEVNHLRVYTLKMLLYNEYLRFLEMESKPKNLKKKLEDAFLLLHGAVYAADNQIMAMKLYRKAEKLLRKDKCDHC